MTRTRRNLKKFFFLVFFIVITSISLGYAVLSRTLAINGNSEVKQNTWDIHFENVQVTNGSVETDSPPALEDGSLSIGFTIQLDLPGDFYEFTVDVVNDGTIDAMLESVTKTPDLSEAQAKYLNYIIEYENGEQLAVKQLVEKESFVRLKIRVEYRKDLNAEDLPTITETLNLAFSVNYVQADNTGMIMKDKGVKIEPIANGSLDDIGTLITIGTERFYTIGTEGDNVKLLSVKNIILDDAPVQSSDAETIDFSDYPPKGAAPNDYNGSKVEEYVNKYKVEIEKMGIKVVEARLITIEELIDENIGCNLDAYNCNNAPSFIYSTSYWTSSGYSSKYIWYVSDSGSLDRIDYVFSYGIRPVIIIPKNEVVDKKIIEFSYLDDTYHVIEGMTWGEFVYSSYNPRPSYCDHMCLSFFKSGLSIYNSSQGFPVFFSDNLKVVYSDVIVENHGYFSKRE